MIHNINDLYLKLGKKVCFYRKSKGLTQERLAENIGKSRSFISALESPDIICKVKLNTLFDIADELEIPPHYLIEDD